MAFSAMTNYGVCLGLFISHNFTNIRATLSGFGFLHVFSDFQRGGLRRYPLFLFRMPSRI